MAREHRTDRLVLRGWREDDREPFAALNADPEVMRHFPAPLSRTESDALAARVGEHLDREGWGLWAVEVVGAGPGGRGRFAGFTGLAVPGFAAPFGPAVEVGWRLARWAWGHGYATEAATAALAVGFDELGLDEIVSFTAVPNERSQAVMRRIGMTRDPAADFDHPRVPPGPLRRHVLYRIAADGRRHGARAGVAGKSVTEGDTGQ
jgi:ribosomal-protein-alanine N-acetyltransferase